MLLFTRWSYTFIIIPLCTERHWSEWNTGRGKLETLRILFEQRERERGRKKCNLHVLSSLSVSTPFFFVCFVRSTVECSLPYNVFNYLARNRQPSTLIIMRWNTVCVCFIFASVAVAPNAFNTLENYIRSYLYLSIVWNGRTRVRWKTKLSIIIFFALCFEEHCLNESRNNTKKTQLQHNPRCCSTYALRTKKIWYPLKCALDRGTARWIWNSTYIAAKQINMFCVVFFLLFRNSREPWNWSWNLSVPSDQNTKWEISEITNAYYLDLV